MQHTCLILDLTRCLRFMFVVQGVPSFGDKVIIIIITILFQEDNIFGTNASLTYSPRLQR